VKVCRPADSNPVVIVHSCRARPAAAPRAVWFGVGLMLVACGRVSLGSLEILEGSAGTGGVSGSGSGQGADAGLPGIGGSGAGSPGTPDAGELGDAEPPFGPEPPSCLAEPRCGLDDYSCCEAPRVPGGTFNLAVAGAVDAGATSATVPATVSSYRLDRFEVTVGRARQFHDQYDAWRASGEPRSGIGRHPRIEGSGWQDEFTVQLPATAAGLEQSWSVCLMPELSTYPAGADNVPLNCVNWYEAFAFCAWDGGRLPTLAELAYAGAGGDENRLYPWGDEPLPNTERAAFGCAEFGLVRLECSNPPTTLVGARPLGVGRFGQYDLAGSMEEWVLDGLPTLAEPCTDCVSLIDVSSRTARGGSWIDGAEMLEGRWFRTLPPYVRTPFNGIRCARD
jgi:sulfatase modifying factor 1